MLNIALIAQENINSSKIESFLNAHTSTGIVMKYNTLAEYSRDNFQASSIFIIISDKNDINSLLLADKNTPKYCIGHKFDYSIYRHSIDCGAKDFILFESAETDIDKILKALIAESRSTHSSVIHSTFASLDDIVVLINIQEEILNIFNDRNNALFSQNHIGKNIKQLPIPENIKSKITTATQKLTETNEPQSFEYSRIINNQVFWFDAKVSWLENENSNIGFVMLARDITERKQTEKDLLKAKKKAEESDRLKSAFLTNMSHEIRTPLNGILGFTQLLCIGFDENDKKKTYANAIQKSSEQLLSIITDIVDISKIESGLFKTDVGRVNIKELLLQLEKDFYKEKKAQNKDIIELNLSFPDNLPEFISTDEKRVTQVFGHLFNNALKFTFNGSISFGIKEESIGQLLCYVSDTGIGIEPENTKAIFELFRQEDDSRTREFGGNGLGLAICKGITSILGGDIWVESNKNIGSTFYFTIPTNSEILSNKNIENQDLKQKELDHNWKGKTILIVEDEELIFEYFKEILSDTEVSYLHTKNGREAVEICKDNPQIDIVLMDIQLPDLNGYEALKSIREFRTELPIIAQTAYALSGDKEKAINAGFNAYISKPINRDLLFGTIDNIFNGKK